MAATTLHIQRKTVRPFDGVEGSFTEVCLDFSEAEGTATNGGCERTSRIPGAFFRRAKRYGRRIEFARAFRIGKIFIGFKRPLYCPF